MRFINSSFLSVFMVVTLCSCPNRAQKTENKTEYLTPKEYTYVVENSFPHLTTSYTQGLHYIDGVMWEGTGQFGESVLQVIDLKTGEAKVIKRLKDSQFGEGITVLGDKLYQLTWYSNTAYVYDLKSGREIKKIRYSGEGWGLTTDGESLYMSNGSETIYEIDPDTFERKRKITVINRGEIVNYINELEWINGRIWANVYTTDVVVIIDPKSGVVEGIINLTGILPLDDISSTTDVLNGIAYDVEGDRVFVTGKNWSKIFEIKIIEK